MSTTNNCTWKTSHHQSHYFLNDIKQNTSFLFQQTDVITQSIVFIKWQSVVVNPMQAKPRTQGDDGERQRLLKVLFTFLRDFHNAWRCIAVCAAASLATESVATAATSIAVVWWQWTARIQQWSRYTTSTHTDTQCELVPVCCNITLMVYRHHFNSHSWVNWG